MIDLSCKAESALPFMRRRQSSRSGLARQHLVRVEPHELGRSSRAVIVERRNGKVIGRLRMVEAPEDKSVEELRPLRR